MADGKDCIRGIVRRDGQPVAAALLPGHGGVHPQGRVGVGQDHFQLTLRLGAGQVELQPDGVERLVVGKDLGGGVAVCQQLRAVEVIAKGLGTALAQLGAHDGQPDEQGRCQQDHQRKERGRERAVFGFGVGLGHGGLRIVEMREPPFAQGGLLKGGRNYTST